MPVHLTQTLDKVHLRAGVATHTFSLAGQVRPTRPWDRLVQFGVLIFWPKALDWLRLSATGSPDPTPAGPPTAFADSPAGLDAVCAAHAARRDQLAPPKFLETYSYLVASLPQHNRVFLKVEVDTDADEFRRAVRDRRNDEKQELVQPVQLLFFDAKQFGNYVGQPGQIDLVMKPCTPVPRFAGVLAIDLGNTTTTAAAFAEADAVYRTDSIRLVPLDPFAPAEPLASVVRLDRVTSAGEVPDGTRRFPDLPGDDRPTAVTFAVGWVALPPSADAELPPGVVYGAKQLLSVKDGGGIATAADSYFTRSIEHARPGQPPQTEAVEVLNRLPGELLFTHAVRSFRQATSSWPADLAITYPTTYSPRELRQLARAATRGWLRAMSQPQSFDSAVERNEDAALQGLGDTERMWLQSPDSSPVSGEVRLIGLLQDEATAATFFHVYRRVFEQPGGLLRFRYLFPKGMRLLLIDCGGGTTDVALVHTISPANAPNLLEIDVLARSGVRAFGGDSITREVCRLLKAKLVAALARSRPTDLSSPSVRPLPPNGPTDPEQARKDVEDFLALALQLDLKNPDLVPTRFDPSSTDAGTFQRRTAAHGLWQLGEEVKRRLGGGDGKPVKLKDLGDGKFGFETSALVAAVLRVVPLANRPQLLAQIKDVAVAPWEVNALVRKPIRAAFDKCNRLIKKHLIDAGHGREYEVDWVVLSGNGARYPLVEQLAREQLSVADAAERVELDPRNLKDAVAKGAAMARMVERSPRKVGIKFNRLLSELLPFDIGYHDMTTNTTIPLFAEYTPYAELAREPKRVNLVLPGGQNLPPGHTFILQRRFPGDDEFTQYASYRFEQGHRGELEVLFERHTGEFAVRDRATREEGTFTDLTAAEHHVAAMRGDI